MQHIEKDQYIYKDLKLSISGFLENWNKRRLQSKQPPQFSGVHPNCGRKNSKGGKTIHFPCIYLVGSSLKNRSFYIYY